MHNEGFQAAGIDGVYLAFEVSDISEAVKGIRALGIRGVSVTIPHKVSVMSHLDEIDEKARKIGAVNTIVNENGRLRGYNTDCDGALSALMTKTEVQGKLVLIAGAGGAARAVGFGLKEKGAQVVFCNRTEIKAKNLAEKLEGDFCPMNDIEKTPWDIIVNTTSVGMTPDVDKMPVPEILLKPGQIVMDIVYNPLKTHLLEKAGKAGCITVDGVTMFVHQGLCQFELWTGQKAPIEIMEEAVRKVLSS